MGMIFRITHQGKLYACKHCQTHLALVKDLISESFRCSHGIAYLVEHVDNVWTGEPEIRKMTSGYHYVVDIFCVGCGDLMGWRYESVMNEENNYKVGRFILMCCKIQSIEATTDSLESSARESSVGSQESGV